MRTSNQDPMQSDTKTRVGSVQDPASEAAGGSENGIGTTSYFIDRKAESRMMRRFDLYAIIPLGLMYMMAILDRSNLGNANIAGMPEEIGLVGNQFGTAATLLFVTYVPFEAPISLLVKSVGPKILISASGLCWGSVTLGMAFIQNYKQLYACRVLMGLFEAGLIPACHVYLGLVYKRSERGRRVCLFYSFSALSSAFGGLLAFGLTQIHHPNFSGWRWMFAVEGIMTIILVPIFYCVFPREPKTAWFLTEDEKRMMQARYDSDAHWGEEDKFRWSDALQALVDPKWYCFWFYQFGVDLTLYGFTTFLPSIVTGLGYTSIHANLMTVPIYSAALAFFLIIAFMSDSRAVRGPFLLLCTALLFIGLVLLIAVRDLRVRFFACFLTALGIYPSTSLSIQWLNDNVARYYKRSFMVGMTLTFANTAGVVVGQIFTTDTAPSYVKGLSICLGFAAFAFVVVAFLMAGMFIANRRRARAIQAGEQTGRPLLPQPEKGDYDVHFKYTL